MSDRSKPDNSSVIRVSFSGDDILVLTLYSVHQAAKYILDAIGHKDEQHWHHVAVRCFHYANMQLIPYCSSAQGDGDQQSSDATVEITSDELIHQWAAQSLITVVQERTGWVTSAGYHAKYNDIYQVGNVIFQAFLEYSLLQLPSSPPTKADDATKSAAHFLAYHSLVAECHTTDELYEGNHPELELMQWISHVDDQGWHVSREWLSRGTSGPTTFIVRHCSQQSRLFMKLQSDHFLAKLPCLCVFDLSYTPLESLPPSISYLQKLLWLSLRGCSNLTSQFRFPCSEATLPDNNNNNNKINLLYLDLSYSNISTFHCDFYYMPNLQDLLLVGCSNLEELPPSIAVLSSLTTLELTDTKIKSFPREIFEEMKLRSLKLIDNKLLGLTEIALDGHGTLNSFSLVGTPHIKRLPLRGCRKLETVDIREVDALEDLDLSATAIKELPDNIPNIPQLRLLLLMGVSSLRSFLWHKLQRLPGVFCLDQCSNRTIDHSDPQVAQATTRKKQAEEVMVITKKLQVALTTYADVNRRYLTDGVSMVSMDDVPPFRETERHVEISTVGRYPDGLKYLLGVTKSISMSDDTHVSSLNDLSYLHELEECKLRRCHKMVHVFNYVYQNRLGQSLKNAYVSHIKSLPHFYREPGYDGDFRALKHLCLENCPRLEGVMPRSCALPSLVTLDILFCYNLKAIFHDHCSSSSDYQLPCLRRIHLQELPLLENLQIGNPILTTRAWEELHVRG